MTITMTGTVTFNMEGEQFSDRLVDFVAAADPSTHSEWLLDADLHLHLVRGELPEVSLFVYLYRHELAGAQAVGRQFQFDHRLVRQVGRYPMPEWLDPCTVDVVSQSDRVRFYAQWWPR